MTMTWEVVSRRTGYVLAQFVSEIKAREYARWRNENSIAYLPWKAQPIEENK